MYNGFGINYKKRLQEELSDEMLSFFNEKGMNGVFGLPLLGYAFTDDKRFMDLYDAGLIKHPKEIYRPGTTVIVSFLPFDPRYVQDNFTDSGNKKTVSDAWTFAYERSIIASAHINTFTLDFLDGMGREASLSTIHTDWNRDTHRPEWSHKIAAYIAGMGEFGPNSCIRTEYGPWGRFNSIITELQLDSTGKNMEEDEKGYEIDIVEDYMTFSLFENPVQIPEEVINSCPCKAISKDGINKAKCQEYCNKLNKFIPEPDACGKCYTR